MPQANILQLAHDPNPEVRRACAFLFFELLDGVGAEVREQSSAEERCGPHVAISLPCYGPLTLLDGVGTEIWSILPAYLR